MARWGVLIFKTPSFPTEKQAEKERKGHLEVVRTSLAAAAKGISVDATGEAALTRTERRLCIDATQPTCGTCDQCDRFSAEHLVFASTRRRRSLSPLCRVVHTVAAVAALTATSCDKTFIFFMMNLPYIEVLPLLDLLGCDGLGVMSESLLKHKPISC